ncbi:MAG: CDP-alcohol phosphatidyltransferase family protein [Polyangia bacterium]
MTLGRLGLIPFCAYLLYEGKEAQLVAVIIGTVIGCTDFVDGWLARKYGTTKLGGLMDPIADKVFTAVVFLPAVDLGWVPWWLVALLFVREFLVTAARTIYERRGLALKSSYLARYKTWVQMCGIGVILFTHILRPLTTDIILGTLAGAPIIGFVVLKLVYKRTWKGAGFFAVSFTGVLAAHHFAADGFALALMYFVVAITWASGLGYFTSVGKLRGKGGLTLGGFVRIVTAITIPAGVVLVEHTGHRLPLGTILVLSCELAHGGLDNLLASSGAESSALEWGSRTFGITGLLAWAYVQPEQAVVATGLAGIVAAVGVAFAFAQKRRFYMDSFTAEGAGASAKPL